MPKSSLEIIQKAEELKDVDVLAENVLDIEEDIEEMEVKIGEIKVIAETTKKEKGEKGDSGYTPIKGVDYVDGVNGRNPLTVSSTEPINPKIGDLWYKN